MATGSRLPDVVGCRMGKVKAYNETPEKAKKALPGKTPGKTPGKAPLEQRVLRSSGRTGGGRGCGILSSIGRRARRAMARAALWGSDGSATSDCTTTGTTAAAIARAGAARAGEARPLRNRLVVLVGGSYRAGR